MVRHRLGSLPLSLLALVGVVLAGSASANVDAADVELICHTDNPAECYPKVFQATDEFQIVHDDQDLPIGLHVRLNVATGQKEAKINVPDEVNPALEGLPVDSVDLVVEPNQPDEGTEPVKEPVKIPANAPRYDPVGKIKEPKKEKSEDKAEATDFYKSLSILKKGLDVDAALEMLEDISHDIYYGLKIAEDYDTVKQLFCLANTDLAATTSRAKLAALTIGSAVQNNPKALAEIERHWPVLREVTCPGSSEPLQTASFRLVSPPPSSDQDSPSLAKARISAISGLIKNDAIRKDFLELGGMDSLLQLLAATKQSTEEWEPARQKATYLIIDNFLDENMGAILGQWPRATDKQAPDSVCAAQHQQGEEITRQCWDWQARRLTELNRKDQDHWSHELWSRLKKYWVDHVYDEKVDL